jgi:hypothetical protein
LLLVFTHQHWANGRCVHWCALGGLVALMMALGLHNQEPPALQSVYTERGIITLSA